MIKYVEFMGLFIKNVKYIMRCKPRLVFAAVLPIKCNVFGRFEEIR